MEEKLNSNTKKSQRMIVGVVVSNKMDKTIVVKTQTLIRHQTLKKIVKKSKKIHAHDKNNECQIGDRVSLEKSRPLSKTKFYKLSEILEKAT